MTPVIVGIDLSFRNTGVAVLAGGKVKQLFTIQTDSKMTDIEACRFLFHSLQSLNYMLSEEYGEDYLYSVEIPAACGAQAPKANRAAGYAVATMSPLLRKKDVLLKAWDIKKLVGQPKVTGPARKKLNLALAYKLYPEANWKMRNNAPMAKEEHKADAVLLAHIARQRLRLDH